MFCIIEKDLYTDPEEPQTDKYYVTYVYGPYSSLEEAEEARRILEKLRTFATTYEIKPLNSSPV